MLASADQVKELTDKRNAAVERETKHMWVVSWKDRCDYWSRSSWKCWALVSAGHDISEGDRDKRKENKVDIVSATEYDEK